MEGNSMMPKYNLRFANAIRLSGRTQSQFAVEMGMKNNWKISRVINGYFQPTEEEKKQWADALGVKATYLFGR